MELEANKAEFIRLLKSTQREGVDYVIEHLEEAGFFQAPASSTQHLNTEGGLVQHSLNTCKAALMLREQMIKMDNSLQKDLKEDSCIIASLLHDVCKTNIYKRTIKKRKNAISPRRRRMLPQPLANDLLRERIAHIGTHTDLHKLHPSPFPS